MIIIEHKENNKNICRLSEEFLRALNKAGCRLTEKQFKYSDLSNAEKDNLYDAFADAYMKSIGSTWDRSEFDWKAEGWTFFGDVTGGIALRKQRSGMWKLNASYGNPMKVMRALKTELIPAIGDQPVWGAMTEDICDMLERATKNEKNGKFKRVPKAVAKVMAPHLLKVFGTGISANPDGSLSAKAPDGSTITKWFIANKVYYLTLLDNAENHPDKVPVPAAVMKGLLGVLRLFIKVF